MATRAQHRPSRPSRRRCSVGRHFSRSTSRRPRPAPPARQRGPRWLTRHRHVGVHGTRMPSIIRASSASTGLSAATLRAGAATLLGGRSDAEKQGVDHGSEPAAHHRREARRQPCRFERVLDEAGRRRRRQPQRPSAADPPHGLGGTGQQRRRLGVAGGHPGDDPFGDLGHRQRHAQVVVQVAGPTPWSPRPSSGGRRHQASGHHETGRTPGGCRSTRAPSR